MLSAIRSFFTSPNEHVVPSRKRQLEVGPEVETSSHSKRLRISLESSPGSRLTDFFFSIPTWLTHRAGVANGHMMLPAASTSTSKVDRMIDKSSKRSHDICREGNNASLQNKNVDILIRGYTGIRRDTKFQDRDCEILGETRSSGFISQNFPSHRNSSMLNSTTGVLRHRPKKDLKNPYRSDHTLADNDKSQVENRSGPPSLRSDSSYSYGNTAFDVNKIVRLEEKEQYRMLLQQLSNPAHNSRPDICLGIAGAPFQSRIQAPSAWPSGVISRPPALTKSILNPNEHDELQARIDVRGRVIPIQIDLDSRSSDSVKDQSPRPSWHGLYYNLRGSTSPSTITLSSDVSEGPSKISKTLDAGSRRESQDKCSSPVLVLDSDSDSPQIFDLEPPSRPMVKKPNARERSEYAKPTYISDIRHKYETRSAANQDQIKAAGTNAKVLKEVREKREKNLEKTLRKQFKDLQVLEPDWESEEEEDVLPVLTQEMNIIIDRALRAPQRADNDVLSEAFSLRVLRKDLKTLNGLNWLNDEVINFYMNLLMERGKLKNFPKVYCSNTFFYPKLMSGGQSALRRWTKKVDIFDHEMMIIPVHLGIHWCLAVVDFTNKSIKYYDSLGGRNDPCLTALKKYLVDEHKDKGSNKPFSINGWTMENVKKIPQQQNGSDCGMFSCIFSYYLSQRKEITFTQTDIPYFRRRMVYEIIQKKLM